MSDARLILRVAGCLLAALLGTNASSWAQTTRGHEPLPQNPMRTSTVVPASYVTQHPGNFQHPPQGMLTAEFLGQTPRSRPVNRGLAQLPMQRAAGASETFLSQPEELSPSDTITPGHMHEEHNGHEFSSAGFDDGCACGGAGCDICQFGVWGALAAARDRTEVYQGITSFSGPINRGGGGSFGFEGGLNMGTPLFGGWRGLGFQAGAGGTMASFNGAGFTRDVRHQAFVTLGLFRRVDWGLQGGFVVDHLHDDWYANVDISQVRGELSWKVPEGSELGFMFAGSNDFQTVTGELRSGTALPTTITETWQVNDIYALFLRHSFCGGGEARLFAGCSGTSDGVLGADAFIPLNEDWSLRNSFTYLVPEQGQLDGGNVKEAWNVSMQLVWYPHGRNACGTDYYRPLFNVANNGSFFIER